MRFEIVESYEIYPYVRGLSALEEGITYPIDDGNGAFFIDHGPHYHPFFSDMGDARFLLVLEGKEVVGVLTGVWRDIEFAGHTLRALYLADLKLAPHRRGADLVLRMLWYGIRELFRSPRLGSWDLVYYAAMRGERGDVTRSLRGGMHPARWVDFHAATQIYFSDPEQLASLPDGCPAVLVGGRVLDLSPDRRDVVHHTRGTKDLRLTHEEGTWALMHANRGPDHWGGSLGAYLREAGAAVLEDGAGAQVCFALDARLERQINWLEAHGVSPGAVCTVYALQCTSADVPPFAGAGLVHIATSTI